MKTLLLFTCSLISSLLICRAQPPQHINLITPTWELIAEKSYVQNTKRQWVPSFPLQLKTLNNTTVDLPGYIIPVKMGMQHKTFLLSVLPIAQCPYCGSGDIPSMVEVTMTKAIQYTDTPIKLRGKLILNDSGDERSELFLVNAEQVK